MSPADFLADIEEAVTDTMPDPLDERVTSRRDPWRDTVAAFLADLLDRTDVRVVTDDALDDEMPPGDRTPPLVPVRGADGHLRQVSVSRSAYTGDDDNESTRGVPAELSDLPAAALRALARVTRPTAATDLVYPSMAKALHDVVIAEVVADRLAQRIEPSAELDPIARLVATTIDYLEELAATPHEGVPVTHGVVIAADDRDVPTVTPPVVYPGRLPTRKRTPLLFDGTESVLVVASSGHVLRGFGRTDLPARSGGDIRIEMLDELTVLDGGLTAAASAAFRGIGFYLRADRSIWVFDDGTPLFIQRASRWKSIAVHAFVDALSKWGRTPRLISERIALAAIRLSIQGQGAVFSVAENGTAIEDQVEPKDRFPASGRGTRSHSVDDELSRLIPRDDALSSSLLARLARVDGATIIDRHGQLLAYGAIVRSFESSGEGARTAAARALSTRTDVAVAVSQDGPITVFVDGAVALELL